MKHLLRSFVILMAACSALLAQSPTTQVLATLTVNPAITRAEITKTLPEEVRATVKLYLDGKIQQWYARGDGKGVIFILNCKDVAEAKALTGELPLIKANFASFEFMPLSPLTPLRFLLQPNQ
jgi:hypothetical protein